MLQLSLVSSTSSMGLRRSSDVSGPEERPVSAENLLPDLSIASITTPMEASRLSSVIHGTTLAPPGRLTRQQTFPPLQVPTLNQLEHIHCKNLTLYILCNLSIWTQVELKLLGNLVRYIIYLNQSTYTKLD